MCNDDLLAWEIEDMPEGYSGHVHYDPDAENPRGWGDRVTTLIQRNSGNIDIDSDDAGLEEAHDRFSVSMMERYLAMFRPDIKLYVDHWSYGGDGYGWGYITTEAWESIGFTGDADPQEVFDAEVDEYGQWAVGEVYGVIVTRDSDGKDASLWGIDDPYPHTYIEGDVVRELIREIEA